MASDAARWPALLPLLAALGCAVNLDPDPPLPAPRSPPSLPSCLPTPDGAQQLEGRLGELTLPDGRELWFAADARVESRTGSAGFVRIGDAPCLAELEPLAAPPLIDTSPVGAGLLGRPLGGVTTDDAYLYFAADGVNTFTTQGYGIARWEPASERFLALALLWTADRPSYGNGAVVEGDYVYVYGGLAARFLSADAYLARVPIAALADPAAYTYWAGGGGYSPNADDALPLLVAGTAPSVAWDATDGRFLMAYSEPLATDITVRSGLGASGPWSLPVTLGRCALPGVDPGAFCGDVTLLPSLATDGGLALGQAVGSFARPQAGRPEDYWTRIVTAPWPEALP